MSAALHLDEASVEAVAHRVAELLRGEDVGEGMIDVAEVARRFDVSSDFVYDHADDLGVVRMGSGPKARLRFDPNQVEQCLAALQRTEATPATPTRRRRRRKSAGSVDLLPISGRA